MAKYPKAKTYKSDIGAIQQQFQSVLGRQPTASEINYFDSLVKEGAIGIPDISQYLYQHPEAQQSRMTQQMGQMQQMLGASDQDILNRASTAAQGKYAQLGRYNTSALGAQMAQQGGQLAQARQQQLANLYAQNMGDINKSMLQQAYGAQQSALGRQETTRQNEWNQLVQKYWYEKQKADYEEGLKKQQSGNLTQALVGAGLGLGANVLGMGAGKLMGALPLFNNKKGYEGILG